MTGAAIALELRDLADLVRRRSRPVAALAFLVAAFDAERSLTPAIVLGTLYFLVPYGLLIHGLDGLAGATPQRSRIRQVTIAMLNLPLLAVLVVLGGAGAGLVLALTVTKAIAWGTPPLRFRDRPGLDVVSGTLLVVLPAICGSLIAGRALVDVPWLAVLALAAWAAAAAAMAAIVERDADRAAGTGSIATALGATVSATVALVGFFGAAALVATLGTRGALAALGLDLYLLLPAMLLTARRTEVGAMAAAAIRAASDARGLHVLVGAWLTLLLADLWGLVTVGLLELAIIVSAASASLVLLNVVTTRLVTGRRRIAEAGWDAEIPALTVIIACLDDAERVADTIAAVRDQTYADATILVVIDEAASDGSADVAAELVGHDGRVLVAPPRPDGWVGANWAAQTGAEAATTELLLFIEGESYLVPIAFRKLVEQWQRGGHDLLSGVTAIATPTRTEQAVAPGFSLMRFGFLPMWLSALTRGRPSRAAYASGSLLLIRRHVYLEVGGHAGRPASHRPAVDLARAVARAGHRVGLVHAADLGATRDVHSFGAAIGRWRRILLPAVGGSLALAIASIVTSVVTLVVPLVLPLVAVVSDAEPRMLVASFAPLGILTAARLALTLTQRQSPVTILYHPVTVIVLLLGQSAAIVDHVTGRRRD